MLSERAREQFRKWGAEGGKRRAKKYSTKQISNMAKRGRKRNGNGK
jgi:hypothetical protein